jgi:hypothetical protein
LVSRRAGGAGNGRDGLARGPKAILNDGTHGR